uniref:CASP-like protein n=1 Tax=Fagus sylvatica TaxID=28930 RepID=A0A2N9JBR3_FAGSY
MRSPQTLRNGETRRNIHTPTPTPHFHSTVTVQKLRRFNSLILVFRLAAFCFSLASSVFMITNCRASPSPHWYDFDAFRFVFAANAIVAVYSLFEMVASVWEISRDITLFPEVLQVWCLGYDPLGVRVPITVGKFGGNGDGQDFEELGHVYRHKCLLRTIGHLDRIGIRWVYVPRVVVFALGV